MRHPKTPNCGFGKLRGCFFIFLPIFTICKMWDALPRVGFHWRRRFCLVKVSDSILTIRSSESELSGQHFPAEQVPGGASASGSSSASGRRVQLSRLSPLTRMEPCWDSGSEHLVLLLFWKINSASNSFPV